METLDYRDKEGAIVQFELSDIIMRIFNSGKRDAECNNGELAALVNKIQTQERSLRDTNQALAKAKKREDEFSACLAKAKKREEEFWECLAEAYNIESREELEEAAQGFDPKNALVVALHYIWKREPEVVFYKEKAIALREFLTSLQKRGGFGPYDWTLIGELLKKR